MWHLLVWGPVLALGVLWSGLCRAVHTLLTEPTWGDGQPGAWLRWLEQWQIPVWLTDWLPMARITELKAWLTAWGPWVEDLLGHAPTWLGWASPVVWFIWALGVLALLLIGVVGSVLVAALRRSPATRAAPARPAAGQAPGGDASRAGPRVN